MSCTSEDGVGVTLRLMDRISPRLTNLAIALEFPEYTIAKLKTEHEPVHYLLFEWLKGANKDYDKRPPTWGTLITALDEAGLIEEVRILKEHFVAEPPLDTRAASMC